MALLILERILPEIVNNDGSTPSRERFELGAKRKVYSLGRGQTNDIKCISLFVSRHHCQIIVENPYSFSIKDLRSSNGTFLNNIRLIPNRRVSLEVGDRIGVGVTEVVDDQSYVYILLKGPNNNIQVGVVSSQQESPDIICLSSDEEDVKPIIGFPLYIDKASEPTVSEAHKPSSPFDPVVPQSSITVPTVVTTQDNHQLPSISSCVTKLSTVNDGVSSSIINNDTSKDLLLDSNPIALSCKSVERCSSPSSSESETFDLNPLPLINDSKKPFRLTKGCKRLSTIDEAIEAKIMRKEENDICPESLPIININKDIKTTCPGLASPSMCMNDDSAHVFKGSFFGSESLNREPVSLSSKETNNTLSYNVSKSITSTIAKPTSSLNQQDSGSKTTFESTFTQAPFNKAVPTESVKLNTHNPCTVPVIESKWKDQPYKEHNFILKNIDSEPSSLISSSNDQGNLLSKVVHSEQIGIDSTALQEENLNTYVDTLSKSIQPENALPNLVAISLSKEVPSDDIKTEKINEKTVNKLQLDLNVHTLFKFKQPELPSCSVSLSNKHSGSSTDAITHINKVQSTKAENVEKELIVKSSDKKFFDITLQNKINYPSQANKNTILGTWDTTRHDNVSEKVIETKISHSHQSNKIGSNKMHSSDTDEGRVDIIKTEIDTTFVKQEINSEPHFNYSLGEDDIIIIDDEDEQFPSSQIFDSSPDPEENKASITEENKIDEFEDDLFQPENDLASSDEDEWFSKLSQNDKIENSSALEEQRLETVDGLALKNIIEEDSEEEIFSVRKQNPVKRTILDDEDEDEDNHDDESNESFTFGLPNDFRNDAQELDEKSKPPLEEISKSNEKFEKKSAVKLGKSLLIDAPPMPPRRASNRGISIAEAERLYNDKATLVSKHRKITEKKNLPSDQNDKSSGKRKHASSGKDSGSSKDLTKSSEKTKSLVDKRKAKLKEISQKHKESSEAVLNDNYNKVKAKARIKVTDKNRGAFLTEELNKSDKPSKISKESEIKYIKTSSDINNIRPNFVESGHGVQESHSWKKKDTFKVANVSDKLNKPGKSLTTSKTPMKIAKTSLNTNVKPNNPLQESLSRKTTTNDNRKTQNDSSLLKKINTNLDEALPSCSNLQRIPRLSFKDLDNPGPMNTSVLSRTHQTPIRSTRGILVQQNKNKPETSNAFSKNCVGRKSVQFKDEEHLKEVHNFPLEETSLMKPVSMLKDKPFKKYNVKDVPYNEVANKYNYPSLDDVICKICTWKPTWFEEQKRCDHPPPIVNKNPKPMFTTFASYETYYSTLQPLMLMELWDKLTQAQAIKNPVVIISVDSFEPCTPSNGEVNKLSEIKCHSLYSHHELQGTKIPRTGDLVALELSLDSENSSEGGRRFTNTFGYLTATNLQTLNDHSIVHKSLYNRLPEPTHKLTMTIKTKYRQIRLRKHDPMRLRVICHIRPYLRVFQALENLKNSPLRNYILNPSAQNINYPKVNETLVAKDILNEAQRRTVLQLASVCRGEGQGVYLIQGPPGTGKSHVIINLIMQLLYGGSRDPRSRKKEKPRILLCAQSNAAIDELVMRLLERRKHQGIGSRFKMVRVGTPDTIHPQVRCISLDELAKTHSQQYIKDAQDTETVQLTLNHLEARIVSMEMKYNSLRDSGKSTDATKIKIDEMIKKMAQIKNMSEGKSAAPIDRRQMRESRLVVLEKAEIVATTLGSCFNMDMEESTRAYNTPRPSFTCCIVDESSKCCEPDILVPLLHDVKNLVLVGDTNQLQATVHSKIAKDLGYAISMFDRLNSSLSLLPSNPVMFLNEQFRMHPEICCWPNYYFYEGRLTCAPFLHHQRITPLKPYLVLSLEYRQGLSRGHSNDGEADFVVEVASIALNTVSQHKLSVGIITPYNQQKETIQNKLREKYPGLGITCDTIDSVQGQERDVVIMSCVRTEGVGFLNDMSRLNVALTRARSALYICGNFTALKDVTAWERLLEDAVRRQVYVQFRSTDTSNQEHIKNIILKQSSHKK